MKKIIFLIALAIAGFFVWRYFKNPQRQHTAAEKAAEAVGDYVPNAIDRKNKMESNISDSMTKENELLQKSLEDIK